MKKWTFFSSLLAINMVFHLLRLPHLILENGGGAFLILYAGILHIVALPLIFVEISLSRSRSKTSLKEMIVLKKASGDLFFSIFMVRFFSFLQVLILFIISCFFVYMTGLSIIHLCEFAVLSINSEIDILENTLYPQAFYGILGVLLIALLAYKVAQSYFESFMDFSSRWVLPFCFFVYMIVFVKILLSFNDFEGIKALFYPDFSQIKMDSLLLAIGQALISLFVGLNFFGQALFLNKEKDSVRIVIHVVIQSLLVTLLIGIFSLPTLQQTTESAFGASWIFAIFPRWLSYSSFGNYYCFLFYLSLGFTFFYLLVLSLKNAGDQLKKIVHFKSVGKKLGLACAGLSVLGTVIFYRQPLKAWWGHGTYISADNIFVNILLPFMCLGLIWMTLTQTKKESRKEMFKHQQVFFHNVYFFESWENAIKYIVPTLVLLAWLLAFL